MLRELFDPTLSNAAGINTSALRFDGTIFSTPTQTKPFLINVYAAAGECLRLDVMLQPSDLEMVVVAPNGDVYRNDDRPLDTRPLVQIANAPSIGWYTVHLAHWNGTPVEGDFVLLYGRYVTGSPNCGQPTPAQSAQAASISAMFDEENAATLKKQTEGTNPVAKPSAEPR